MPAINKRPQIYDRDRLACLGAPHLRIHGRLQRQRGVTHILAESLTPLDLASSTADPLPAAPARDFR